MRLREPEVFATSGALVMRNEVDDVVLGLGYVKRRCLLRLGLRLHKMGVFASSGALVMRNEVAGIVLGLGYTKRSHLPRFGAWFGQPWKVPTLRTVGEVSEGRKLRVLRHTSWVSLF